jgi:putative ABC transport system substrate-binding protein
MHTTIGRGYRDQYHAESRRRETSGGLCTVGILIALALGILVVSLAIAGQPLTGKVRRIGYLSPGFPPLPEAFRQGLRELGWVEDQNLAIESRWAEGKVARFPELATELVHLGVDVLVVSSVSAALVVKDMTHTIPIVMLGVNNPVEAGLVTSLARPGGNITGLDSFVQELDPKRLQLLQEVVPGLTRVAFLWDATNPLAEQAYGEMRGIAQALGLTLLSAAVRGPEEFESVLAAMTQAHAEALFVLATPLNSAHSSQIAALALKSGLPTMCGARVSAMRGCLIAYGPSSLDMFRRGAIYVDKILKGAKPADLPVERPMKFELVINLKTAKALGLTMPPALLFQATEVIQ